MALAQPPNDQCSAVTPIALATGSSLTLTGTRTGATTANDGVPSSVLMTTAGVATVWEAFTTTTCSNVSVLYCGTALPATTMWNFLSASCPADQPIYFSYANFGILCPNGQFGIQWFNLPAGTYYLPIYCTSAGGAYSLQLSAAACLPGPANDECAGATALAVNTTCVTTNGSVENGTLSMPATECNSATGDANDDVWFSFVATGTMHTITMNGLGGDIDGVIELYDGNCSASDLLACGDATLDGGIETIEATDLTVGTTYYVRVFHWYTALALEPAFTICVTGDTPTGIAEAQDVALLAHPNPTNGLITLEGLTANSTVVVRDAVGRAVMQQRIAGTMTTLDLTDLPAGTYLIESLDSDRPLRTTVLKR